MPMSSLHWTVASLLVIGAATSHTNPLLVNCQKLNSNQSVDHISDSIVQHLSNLISSTHQTIESPNVYNNKEQSKLTSPSSVMLKTFIRTNQMRSYHLDLHSYRDEAKFSGDPTFVDSQNEQHIARCSNHLSLYHKSLKSFSQNDPITEKDFIDSMRLADTFGRPESGVFDGNQFWLGSYDTCKSLSLPVADDADGQPQSESHAKAQYCIGVAQFANWNPKESQAAFKVGLCLPETCTSYMLNNDKSMFSSVETMMKYQFSDRQPYASLKLREVYCLPHDTSKARTMPTSGYAFVAVMSAFIGSCVLATIVDHIQSKSSEDQLKPNSVKQSNWKSIVIESFSITRNVEKLFNTSSPHDNQAAEPDAAIENKSNFNKSTLFNICNGIKCIGLIWIIVAHTWLIAPIPSRSLNTFDRYLQTIAANVVLAAHLMVDTFFVLSGVFASFLLFKQDISKVKTKHWVILSIHRYWRLTPIYVLIYWYTKSVGSYQGEGPLWDYGTSAISPRLNCARESWLEALLHLSDFKSPKEHCVPFAWFIANGIKFWLATPIILTVLAKSTSRGYKWAMSMIMANIILVIALAAKSSVDIKSVLSFKPESANNMLNDMSDIYVRPYTRFSTYLIGIIAGHLFYLIDTNQVEIKLSKNAKKILWTACIGLMLLLIFSIKLVDSVGLVEGTEVYVFSVASGLIRPLWALCTCWVLFGLSIGHAPRLSRFLSAKFWRVLVRLSFVAYLCQGEIIAFLYLTPAHSTSITFKDLVSGPILMTVYTMIASIFIVVLIEYPLTGIEQLVLPPKRSHNAKSPISSSTNGKRQPDEDDDNIGNTSAPADTDKSQTLQPPSSGKLKCS